MNSFPRSLQPWCFFFFAYVRWRRCPCLSCYSRRTVTLLGGGFSEASATTWLTLPALAKISYNATFLVLFSNVHTFNIKLYILQTELLFLLFHKRFQIVHYFQCNCTIIWDNSISSVLRFLSYPKVCSSFENVSGEARRLPPRLHSLWLGLALVVILGGGAVWRLASCATKSISAGYCLTMLCSKPWLLLMRVFIQLHKEKMMLSKTLKFHMTHWSLKQYEGESKLENANYIKKKKIN